MTFDDLFALTPSGTGRWTAPGAPGTDERMVFGGLVIGQAIVAASWQTRRCHSLHAFFIGPGEKQVPFEIAVERTRDGGSFSTRQVQIHQGERLLLAGYSSHHDGNEGPEHQIPMPEAPPPDSVEDFSITRNRHAEQLGKPRRQYLADRMLDVRPVELASAERAGAVAVQAIWFRSREAIAGDQSVHQAAIGFASDVGLVRVGLLRHAGAYGQVQTASLDHSIWFHREAAADDWMLHVMRSPVARNGRGLSEASVFTREGELVASVAQEFLARSSRPKPSS